MKPKIVNPDSPAGKIFLKMLEDQKWINAYLRDEITKEELEARGIKLHNPFKNDDWMTNTPSKPED
jgi:hypothetical protein